MSGVGFEVRGIPVRMTPGFLAMSVALYAMSGGLWSLGGLLGWIAVVLISVLVHELGHARVAQMNRLYVRQIALNWHGGVCVTQATSLPMVDLRVALGGPAAGLALAALAWTVSWVLPLVILQQLVAVNITWSLFNLLPIQGLDGHRALTSWRASKRY